MARTSRIGRKTLTAVAAASLLATATATTSSAAAQPLPNQSGRSAASQPHKGLAHARVLSAKTKLVGFGQASSARQAVFVQLSGSGAATASQRALARTPGTKGAKQAAAKSAVLDRRAEVTTTANSVMSAARRTDSKAVQIFQVSNAVPGVGMIADRAALNALAKRSDVVKISVIVPKTAQNSSAAQLTKVLQTWQDTHTFGTGVTVGVIDTGLDYTHADFGGVGTAAAFTAAQAKSDSQFYDWYGNLPALAKAKIAGGFDFVGDAYDATATDDTYNPIPTPNPNPLGCDSHGTHVAGTVAGYGENANGSTFTGSYDTLSGTDLDNMKIGPGMAPEAKLYPLKIFGCFGGTDAVIPALDAALDPNDDGDLSDHLDIVNLSLGSDYSTADDPENAVVNTIAEDGVLPVISMGNGGDLTDIGGAPGNSVRALAAASSVDAYQLRDGLQVNAPLGVEPGNVAAGQNSSAYDYAKSGDVVNQSMVTMPGDDGIPGDANNDGCSPFTAAEKAAVKGKTVWLEWDDNDATRACGSAARGANAVAAGATGVILTSTLNVFNAGIAGVEQIPMFQLTKTDTDLLRQQLSSHVTVNVSFLASLKNSIKTVTPSIEDNLSSFSSRGPHGSTGVIKPDVAAPGDTIASAGLGTGNGVLVDSGTSMASPHTAGIAALVKETHPTWTVEQIKAAVMNGADHDLYTGPNKTGEIYGPARDGAGRVDALASVTTNVIAYDSDADEAGGVSASFGVVPAPAGGADVVKTRTITVENHGSSATTVALSYAPAVTEPGVSYSVTPNSLPVGAGASATATVTMTVHSADLRHTIDQTMDATQIPGPGAPAFARQYLSDASGRIILQPATGPRLRVPVYGAAKPTSNVTAAAGRNKITLTGPTFSQGDLTTSSGWSALSVPMGLDSTSSQLPACSSTVTTECTENTTAKGGDIHYVGSGSFVGQNPHTGKASLANGYFYIGLAMYGDNATIGNSTVPYVEIDVNNDGEPDFGSAIQPVAGTDLYLNNVIDLNTGDTVDQEFINFFDGSVDTNVFDTNTVVMPIALGALGVTDSTKTFPITYTVGTASSYAVNANGDIDDIGPVKVDAVHPKVDLAIQPGFVPLYDSSGAIKALVSKPATKALVLNLHNPDGNRAQVVTLNPDTSRLSIYARKTVSYGHSRTVSGTLTDATTHAAIAKATVALYGKTGSGAYTLRTTKTTNSAGKVSALATPKSQTTYQWRFAGSPGHGPVNSATKTISVAPLVSLSTTSNEVAKNERFRLYGTTRPATAGATLAIQEKVKGKWTTVATVKTKKHTLPNRRKKVVGYVVGLKIAKKGSFHFRATWAAHSGLTAATSRTVIVRVKS